MAGKITEWVDANSNGEVKFPEHMMQLHRMWTYGVPSSYNVPTSVSNKFSGKTLSDLLADTIGASPYANVEAYPGWVTNNGMYSGAATLFNEGLNPYLDGTGTNAPPAAGDRAAENFWQHIKWIYAPGWITASKTKASELIGKPSGGGNNWFTEQGIWDFIPDIDSASELSAVIAAAYGRFAANDPRWERLNAGVIDLDDYALPAAPEISSAGAVAELGELSAPNATMDIDAAVDAFETRQQRKFQEGIGRIAAGMYDIRAMMNSQFGVALALAESERREQAAEFEAGLRTEQARLNHAAQVRLLELEAERDARAAQMIMQAVIRNAELKEQRNEENARIQLDGAKFNDQSQFAAGQAYQERVQNHMRSSLDYDARLRELNQARALAKWQAASSMVDVMYEKYKTTAAIGSMAHEAFLRAAGDRTAKYVAAVADEQQMNLQLEVKDALWDMELYAYANQALSAVGGAPGFREPSRFERLVNAFGVGVSAATGLGSLVIGAIGAL